MRKRCLNLGSYNYLGFAAADEYCTPRVLDTLAKLGWASCSARVDAGDVPQSFLPPLAVASPAPSVSRVGHERSGKGLAGGPCCF